MFFKKLTIKEQIEKNRAKLITSESNRIIYGIDNDIKRMIKDLRFATYYNYELDENFRDEICKIVLEHFEKQDSITVEHEKLNSWNNEFRITIQYSIGK